MAKSYKFILLSVLFLTPFLAETISAQVSVAKLFSNNMVLQQNSEVSIWGRANAGDTILVTGSWNNETVKAVAGPKQKWQAELTTPAAKTDGTAYTVTIKGKNTITLSNVLIGEVWLLSGQSNMEMQLQGWIGSPIEGGKEAIATANFPEIRLMTIFRNSAGEPEADIANNTNSLWMECSPSTVFWFSAVGYFFGRELHNQLNIPIGLVHSAWGGSSCETWAEESSLDFVADYANSGPWKPNSATDNHTATVLYNGMIAPLVPFNFAGVCWYQGETNANRYEQLTELFPAMIEGWRNVFGKEDLPFYFVQLAPFNNYGNGILPAFWEAQANALNLHHTEMVSTLDVGDKTNIHPARKEPVGYRLAQKALANVYGFDSLVYAGPRYKSHAIEGNKIRLSFTHTGSGLKTADGTLRQFEIAGNNNFFYAANAEIDGEEIVVSSANVAAPQNVRYAWNRNATASLYNNEGFPAPPFRTNPPEYIQPLNSKLLSNTQLINEGETVELKWTTIGGDTQTINNSAVAASGSIAATPDTTTTYTLKATKGDLSSSASQTVFVIAKELNNWSPGKITEASSGKSGYESKYAVDSNLKKKWRSNSFNTEWITVDLGETVPVNLIVIHWGAEYGKAYKIQVSDDNQNWTTIFTENSGDGAMDFIPDLNNSGRYVRMQGTSRSGYKGYEINEFKIYSTEKRETGTLHDKLGDVMRGTPMVLGKNLNQSVQFASDVNNWKKIKNNGFNTIRVCWVDPWYKDHDYNHWSVSEVLPYFDKCVQNATEAEMNIIINFHNVGAQQNYDTEFNFELEKEFWDSIAPRYKNNNLVYYEITNEPVFKTDDYLKAGFKQKLLEIYNSVRLAAPEREVLLFSFSTIANGIIDVVEGYKDSIDWDKTSVAYHMYNSNSSDAVQTLMAYHRVICTEWNYDHVAKNENKAFIQQVDGFKENAQTLENMGSGWIDWRDWSDTTLNELLDTLIFDARQKNYWWGKPVAGLKATHVKISPQQVGLKSGETMQLTASVYPALAENQDVAWSSSNTANVWADANGLITAKATQSKSATITATTNDGGFTATCEVTVIPPEKKGAYSDGTPHTIPGTINPTHYDLGGEGVGYHDLDNTNSGDGIRQEQGVDTEYRLEEGTVGGIQTGEWLEYTIDVQEAGNYTFEILLATPGRYGKFHIEIDGNAITGEVYARTSGSMSTFKPTKIENIALQEGEQIMRLYFDFANYNLGTISIYKSETTGNISFAQPNNIELFPNPVKERLFVRGYESVTGYTIQNLSGQVIQKGNFAEVKTIDTSLLPAGNYLILLEGEHFHLTKKIVKL